ncbi:FIVAR domain-containing protein [Collinsella vaginalis]|uniref:FIVAR domain-containing protein n=1 Tax=Collinsella vaginalis TaxID=1870987 RepID=UPI000A26F0D5|nr:FIVAR domain-containing protein [Collinsella vaginalis]
MDSSHWTKASADALSAAISFAESVTAQGDAASQAAADLAKTALESAMSGGTEVAEADKLVLDALISQTWAIGPRGFAAEPYAALQTAIDAAKNVYGDRWASQDEVDAAVAALKDARAALTAGQ